MSDAVKRVESFLHWMPNDKLIACFGDSGLYAKDILAIIEENKRFRDALTTIRYMHTGNPSDAMLDMPKEDYAEHILRCANREAREALEGERNE